PSGFHEIAVPDSHCCTNNVVIEAAIHGPGSFFKTGAGTLQLNGANDYTGLTLIQGGLVSAASAAALGTADSSTIVDDGSTLWLNFAAGTVNEQLILSGAGLGETNGALRVSGNIEVRNQFPAIFPTMEISSNTTIRVDSGQLTITGEIRGDGSLIKTG